MEIHLLVLKLERRLGHKDVKLPLMTADVKDVWDLLSILSPCTLFNSPPLPYPAFLSLLFFQLASPSPLYHLQFSSFSPFLSTSLLFPTCFSLSLVPLFSLSFHLDSSLLYFSLPFLFHPSFTSSTSLNV